MQYKNTVKLQGKLTERRFSDDGTRATIVVRTKKSRNQMDLPSVIFSGPDVEHQLKDYKIGEYVYVEGTVRSRSAMGEDISPSQEIIGQSIEHALTEEEKEGYNGGKLYTCENRVTLQGKVSSFEPTGENRFNVELSIEDNEEKNNIRFSIFHPSDNVLKLKKLFKKDSPVFVMGEVQTKPARKDQHRSELIVARSYQGI